MNNLPKACVILGAGASHDVHSKSSVFIDSAWCPPLAIDLFDIENHQRYFEILQLYPGAAQLTQLLNPQIASGQIGLEEALRKLATHKDDRILKNFKQIPAYIRDLIYMTSNYYTQIPSSYVQLTTELMTNYPHEVLFLTLNYDTLLERSLYLLDSKYQFNDIANYVSFYDMKLIKLHGSIDWFSCIPQGTLGDWITAINIIDPLTRTQENDISILHHIARVAEAVARIEETICYIYPVLTVPLAGKNIDDAVCPQSHIDVAKEFLKDCSKFLIIGCSGLDNDLFHLLNSSVNPQIKPLLHIVGLNDVNIVFNRFRAEVKVFNELSQNGKTTESGFRSYLQSDSFKTFLL